MASYGAFCFSFKAFHLSPRSLPTSPSQSQSQVRAHPSVASRLTELDARVLIADLITGVVGEEHVGRKTALWHVRIWQYVVSKVKSATAR